MQAARGASAHYAAEEQLGVAPQRWSDSLKTPGHMAAEDEEKRRAAPPVPGTRGV